MVGGTALDGGRGGGQGRGRPEPGTRLLLAVVIGLGVLILAGFVLVVVTLAHRLLGGAPHGGATEAASPLASVSLGEPPGTRILSSLALGDRLALVLGGGGGEDRVVLLDSRTGAPVARIRLGAAPAAPPR